MKKYYKVQRFKNLQLKPLFSHLRIFRKLINAALITTGLRNLSTTRALMKNHYEVLGVSRNATQAEIKNAYFELSKMYHPDKIAATDENLKRFREISEAYEILGNDHSRKLYDTGLLGDVKRVGAEGADLTDPIVAFYKQRQDMAKVLGVKPDGMGIWTQSQFAAAKQKQRHDLFSMRTTGGIRKDSLTEEYYHFLYTLVLAFLFFMNFENTAPERAVKHLMEFFK